MLDFLFFDRGGFDNFGVRRNRANVAAEAMKKLADSKNLPSVRIPFSLPHFSISLAVAKHDTMALRLGEAYASLGKHRLLGSFWRTACARGERR